MDELNTTKAEVEYFTEQLEVGDQRPITSLL